jgi:hypothetical protein
MNFQNVAYSPDRHTDKQNEYNLNETNRILTKELSRCGIDVVVNPDILKHSEPYTIITGKFGRLKFERAWTYWCVNGFIPLDIAEKIYNHPVGKTDVRVAGHCGCVAPVAPWIKWIDRNSGMFVLSSKDKKEFEDLIVKYDETTRMGQIAREAMVDYIFNDDPMSIHAQAFVTGYHIDSELGLYVFMQYIKECSDIKFVINVKRDD